MASGEAPAADALSVAGTVAVVADDLIWASRLVAAVERAGAVAARLSSAEQLAAILMADDEAELEPGHPARLLGAIVDLNGRRYDGVEAVATVAAARKPVLAVAQHDDQLTRRRALDAGALRVFSYAKLFNDGPAVVARWLAAEARP